MINEFEIPRTQRVNGEDAENTEDFDWEAKYMEMVRELPLDAMPSALLEERTVKELRSRGLLRRQRWLPASWLVGSVAASVALFAMGVVVGQWMGTRSTIETVATFANTPAAAAANVQQTGTAYVQALEALVNAANTQGQPQQSAQAREVALTALHAAANEVIRLAPNDPVAMKILQGIEQAKLQAQPRDERDSGRKIVWF
jgi:predicted RNase H-like HicB family nuclease